MVLAPRRGLRSSPLAALLLLVVPYHYAATGVFAVGTVYALTELVAAFSGASDAETLRELDEASAHNGRALGAVVAAFLGSVLLSIPAKTHMYRSIDLFNAGLAAPSPGARESPLRPDAMRERRVDALSARRRSPCRAARAPPSCRPPPA